MAPHAPRMDVRLVSLQRHQTHIHPDGYAARSRFANAAAAAPGSSAHGECAVGVAIAANAGPDAARHSLVSLA